MSRESYREILRGPQERIVTCERRYEALPKRDRVRFDLYPDPGGDGYNGRNTLRAVNLAIQRVLLNGFPISYHRNTLAFEAASGEVSAPLEVIGATEVNNIADFAALLEGEVAELEERLTFAEVLLAAD